MDDKNLLMIENWPCEIAPTSRISQGKSGLLNTIKKVFHLQKEEAIDFSLVKEIVIALRNLRAEILPLLADLFDRLARRAT